MVSPTRFDPSGSMKRTDVRHTDGSEDFLSFRRREPMLIIIDVVIDQIRAAYVLQVAGDPTPAAFAGDLPNLTVLPERRNVSQRLRRDPAVRAEYVGYLGRL